MTISRQAWLWAGLLFSGAACAQVDPAIGGAPTDLQVDFAKRYGLGGGAMQFASDPKNSGRTVMLSRVSYADPLPQTVRRNDVYPLGESTRNTLDPRAISRWYAMSVYFPGTWNTADKTPTVVAQVDTVQNVNALKPPFVLLTRGSDLELQLNFNHRALNGVPPATAANSSAETIVLDSFQTGKWYCFVLRATWSPVPGVGELALWMNGYENKDIVYRTLGGASNAYETDVGYMPRVGLVYPEGMAVAENSLYADFVWLGGANSSAQMMFKKTPCAAQPLAQIAAGAAPATAAINPQ